MLQFLPRSLQESGLDSRVLLSLRGLVLVIWSSSHLLPITPVDGEEVVLLHYASAALSKDHCTITLSKSQLPFISSLSVEILLREILVSHT